MQKNQEVRIDITALNEDGLGQGRFGGLPVLVKGALPGETVSVKIIKVEPQLAVGKLNKILSPSPDRVEPFCPVYPRCGGCSLQHLKYAAQLRLKTETVKTCLRDIAGIEQVQIFDTIGMASPLHYRNKAMYPVGMQKGGLVVGFYAQRTHEVVPHTTCDVQHPLSNQVKAVVEDFLRQHHISGYDERTGKGLVRHLVVRVGLTTRQVMVVLVINGNTLPARQKLIDQLKQTIPGLKSVFLNINRDHTNVIFGEETIKLFGKGTITDRLGEYMFALSPVSFFQVNPAQAEVLYRKAVEFASLSGRETVVDLYCGIGTISLFLAAHARKVYGVEVVKEAIFDARKNAERNEVRNVTYLEGHAHNVVPKLLAQGTVADVVVIDPPRGGCDEALLKMLGALKPHRIVYVSCNPATLARDLRILAHDGYVTRQVQPVDMFPYTPWVECVAQLEYKGDAEN